MEAILKDDEATNARLERAKARQDHFVAEKGEQILREEEQKREDDPREKEEPNAQSADIQTPAKMYDGDEQGQTPLADGPAKRPEARLPSPVRKPAVKRK